jgi:hypothetical protein
MYLFFKALIKTAKKGQVMRNRYKVINLLSGLITIIDARTSQRAMSKGREYFGTSQVIVI